MSGHDHNQELAPTTSNPFFWAITMLLTMVLVGGVFAHMFSEGQAIAANHPLPEIQGGPVGPVEPDHSALIAALDKSVIRAGKDVYQANCITCHGADGGTAVSAGSRNFRQNLIKTVVILTACI